MFDHETVKLYKLLAPNNPLSLFFKLRKFFLRMQITDGFFGCLLVQASVAKLEQQGRAAAVERADLFSKGVQHSNQLQKLKQAVSVQPAGQVPAQLPACASCQTLTEQVKRLEVIVADLLPLSESRSVPLSIVRSFVTSLVARTWERFSL